MRINVSAEIPDQPWHGLAGRRVAALEINRQYLPKHGAHRQAALRPF